MRNDVVQELTDRARQLRLDVVRMVHAAGDGHPGPAMSVADIVTALYFHVMRVDPARPRWESRDRLLLSKGHSCPIVYAALARKGFFSPETFSTLRQAGSILQGHPVMGKTPGIDMTTGSLGHGLSAGAGMAAAGRLSGEDYFVYVITGDGELNEGIVWEAARSAAHLRLGHLIAFIDHNGFQSGGSLLDISGPAGAAEKFTSFGWHVQTIDGHDFDQILDAVERAKADAERPSAIIADTVKGKGLSFMERDNTWHKRTPTADEVKRAEIELGDRA